MLRPQAKLPRLQAPGPLRRAAAYASESAAAAAAPESPPTPPHVAQPHPHVHAWPASPETPSAALGYTRAEWRNEKSAPLPFPTLPLATALRSSRVCGVLPGAGMQSPVDKTFALLHGGIADLVQQLLQPAANAISDYISLVPRPALRQIAL